MEMRTGRGRPSPSLNLLREEGYSRRGIYRSQERHISMPVPNDAELRGIVVASDISGDGSVARSTVHGPFAGPGYLQDLAIGLGAADVDPTSIATAIRIDFARERGIDTFVAAGTLPPAGISTAQQSLFSESRYNLATFGNVDTSTGGWLIWRPIGSADRIISHDIRFLIGLELFFVKIYANNVPLAPNMVKVSASLLVRR